MALANVISFTLSSSPGSPLARLRKREPRNIADRPEPAPLPTRKVLADQPQRPLDPHVANDVPDRDVIDGAHRRADASRGEKRHPVRELHPPVRREVPGPARALRRALVGRHALEGGPLVHGVGAADVPGAWHRFGLDVKRDLCHIFDSAAQVGPW